MKARLQIARELYEYLLECAGQQERRKRGDCVVRGKLDWTDLSDLPKAVKGGVVYDVEHLVNDAFHGLMRLTKARILAAKPKNLR